MRRRGLISAIAVSLVVFALIFFIAALATPAESFDEKEGFGKVFAASPELSFDTGSLVTSFGDFSFSLNFTFAKPGLSFLADGQTLHVHFIWVIIFVGAMISSCVVTEVSFATSALFSVFAGIAVSRLFPVLREMIDGGVDSWECAASSFWFISFIFTCLIINGIVGIGGKLVGAMIINEIGRSVVAFVTSALIANAISIVLCLFVYLTVGLGWCGGVMLWFILAVLFIVFCEIMDIISF